jgi:hypothetical protein
MSTKEVLAAAKRVVAKWQEFIQTMDPDPIAAPDPTTDSERSANQRKAENAEAEVGAAS